MNIPEIAAAITTLLTPYLPALVEHGQKALEGAAGKIGEKAVEGITKIWQRLSGKAEEKVELKEALKDSAAQPADAGVQAALRVQLRKLLESDPALAKELHGLLQGCGNTVIVQNVSGTGNIVSARDQHIGNLTQNF